MLFFLGVVLNCVAVWERGEENIDKPEVLTTQGLHRLTRNPMYVGYSAIHIGLAVWTSSAWTLATWPVSFALVHHSVRSEEDELAERFGASYTAYQKRTPRYL